MTARPRFPLFDSLRAIAALSIFAFHIAAAEHAFSGHALSPWLRQLNVGVPIFFVVSGFLLYRPFVARKAQGRPFPSLRGYGVRRALRIVPAYWVALPLVALLLGRADQVFTPSGVVTYFGFLQVYDPSTITGGIGQAWTLGVEVAFYAFLPLWALAIRRLPGELRPLAWLAIAGVAWKLFFVATLPPDKLVTSPAVIALPAWLETFAAGMALAVVSVRVTDLGWRPRWVTLVQRRPWVPWSIAAAAFALVGFKQWQGGVGAQVLAEYELKTVVAAGLVLPAVLGDPTRGWVRRALASPPLLWVGLVSYAFYLWHLAAITKLEEWGVGRELGAVGLTAAALAGSLAIAALSWYALERPILRRARRLTGPTAQTRTLADDQAALAAREP
jgi:peptidoglycan/LPS O-acetylase OafA/YrhL